MGKAEHKNKWKACLKIFLMTPTDNLMYKIYVRQNIEQGLQDSEEGWEYQREDIREVFHSSLSHYLSD